MNFLNLVFNLFKHLEETICTTHRKKVLSFFFLQYNDITQYDLQTHLSESPRFYISWIYEILYEYNI